MKLYPTQELGSLRKPRELTIVWFSKDISYEELHRLQDRASKEVIQRFEEIGLDILWDGEMHRWEMYQHPIEHIDGFRFLGFVRSWDNRYFKKAACIGPVRLRENYHLQEFRCISHSIDREIKVPVTGPYTLADWSFNEYYYERWRKRATERKLVNYSAKREFTLELASNVINPILRELASIGAKRIQIDEPAGTTHPKEMPIFVEAFNRAVEGVDCKISVHICYGDYTRLFPYVLDMKTSQFTLEFANRDMLRSGVSDNDRVGYNDLQLFEEYGDKREIGLGVVDVHTDDIEEPSLIKDRILYATKILDDPNRVYVNPDCGLRTRSRQVAFAKLKSMVEGAELARKAF